VSSHYLRNIKLSKIDLSIIIVNYKCWDVLARCIDSFNKYKPHTNYEIIIVDNDSQDGKFNSFQQQFHEIKLIANKGNYGFSSACNLGADNAKGDFLLFLNPDVTLTSSPAIDEMFNFAKANTNVGITSCRTIYPNGKREREVAFLSPWLTIGWLRALYKFALSRKIANKFPENKNIWYPEWVAGSVILIQKDFFKKIGKWSEDKFWMYSEDPDICLKSNKNGKKIALLRNVEIKHQHGGSSRRNTKTTAITKSEVVTSSHVFIHEHSSSINRVALHLVIMVNTLTSWLLRTLITLPFFWKDFFKANLFTLIAIIKYYLSVLIRWNWKSKRLKKNES
jgi:GT2 family glycosyltransferase|tara:strand:+ start:58 stop:1068 length:1011 start_codon:yes stop_codon:yes gene_type:complete